MFKSGAYDFSDKEIDQIVQMVKDWAAGSERPIDRRRISRQVLRWAETWGLARRGADMRDWRGELPWFVEDAQRFYYTGGKDFWGAWVLPQEALWRLVEPMLQDSRGRSIARDRRWNELGLYAEGQAGWNDKALDEIVRVLVGLDQWGYLVFQYAGSTWVITLTPERAVRSEV